MLRQEGIRGCLGLLTYGREIEGDEIELGKPLLE